MTLVRSTTLLAGLMAAGSAHADGADLTVFDWAGYEDPAFYESYIASEKVAPTYAYFADEEEAFQKLRAGFQADAAHPCSQSVPKWIEAGLLDPIDTARIPAWKDLEPEFRDIPAYQKDGKPYFVPVDWGNTVVVYNSDLLSDDKVASLKAFADPANAGRISIGDNVDDAYALAFLATGVTDWTKATDEDFAAASAFLRQVHPNVRVYWDSGASLQQLMQSGEVYLAWAWNETFATLSAEGLPIKSKRDTEEGSSSWVCGYVNLKDGTGPDDLFYEFVNAWLEPKSADYLVNSWGYGHSNSAAMATMEPASLEAVGLNTSDSLRAHTLWQAPVPTALREKMIAEFELIKAGF